MTDPSARPSVPARLGLALVAGLAGAAAMLVSQTIEMRLNDRDGSDVPARAVEALTGVEVADGAATERLSTAAHFAFGTGLGIGAAVLDDVPVLLRLPLFAAGAWSAGVAVMTLLDVSEPPTRWPASVLGVDLAHHAVYSVATLAAYRGASRAVAPR